MKNDLYEKSYGAWAGNRAGRKPDFTRCCESVSADSWHFRQCSRKRGYGPDGAYCKQHDPAAVKAKREEQTRKYNADYNKRRMEWKSRTFFDALELIANGHNDARGLAQAVIEEFKKGQH